MAPSSIATCSWGGTFVPEQSNSNTIAHECMVWRMFRVSAKDALPWQLELSTCRMLIKIEIRLSKMVTN